ncbi:hypothetical protein [Sinomonas cellulolyticus]|nr:MULTISPECIES: hypothetical protein [Sinomonas]
MTSARANEVTMSTPTALDSVVLLRRSLEALSALGAQFLLGMGANLFGSPEDAAGGARIAAGIVLGLHALVGLGLVVVGIRVLTAARRLDVESTTAVWALAVVVLTFLAGLGTMMTGNDWLSFAMSVGFAVTAALYVRTLLAAARIESRRV